MPFFFIYFFFMSMEKNRGEICPLFSKGPERASGKKA